MKGETELYKMVEAAVMDEKQKEGERGLIRDVLEELRKKREEEDEERTLIEEIKSNLGDAQNKSFEVERKLNQVLWEYIEALDKERGRPQHIMTKLWQMVPNRDTKNLNFDNKPDGANRPGQRASGRKTKKKKSNNRHSPGLMPQMESTMSFVSEWVSVKEMKAPQGACMHTSSKAREQQCEEILSCWDDRRKFCQMTAKDIC